MVPPNMTIDTHRSSDDFLTGKRSSLWPEVKAAIGPKQFWDGLVKSYATFCLFMFD